MKFHWVWLPVSILSMLIAGAAAAIPITFQLDSTTAVGGSLVSAQVYTPGFPIMGSGDIDFGAGTGTLTLQDYSFTIDTSFSGPDGIIDSNVSVTNWTQTITSIDGSGNITSIGSGTISCSVLGGLGSLICANINAVPTVQGWPPADGGTPSSAVLDTLAQTITVTDNSSVQAGTVTSIYSYTIVPEPGAALLIGGGLMALATRRRSRSA